MTSDRPRPLLTILFTDIVGSTERAVEMGDRRWKELLGRHDEKVRAELRRFGGREVNTAGDGFIATFDRPDRAVECACAIRDAVAELDLEVRAGLHTGQVEGEGRQIGGIAVHVAARVSAEGGAGDVLVSRSVHDAIEGGGFEFEDIGVRDLKGVPGDRRLYRVTGLPAAEATPPPTPRRRWHPAWIAGIGLIALLGVALLYGVLRDDGGSAPGPGEAVAESADPAIAILPFTVQGVELDMWREGMVDVLSANLDGVGGLRAIDSRTVLARWREAVEGGEVPDTSTALEVARRTGARYALIGSVVASGEEMRILSDLYDLRTDGRLGEPHVEGRPDSIFGLVDRLSIEVLRPILEGDRSLPSVDLGRATTSSLPALKAFLRAEAHYRAGDFLAAIPLYLEVVDADSTFGMAYYRLARSYGWLDPTEQSRLASGSDPYAEGEDPLEKAYDLVERLPERNALLVRGLYAFRTGQREGLEILRTGTERYPDDPEAWDLLGDYLYHHGGKHLADPREGRRAYERAIDLDPGFAAPYIHHIDNTMRYEPDSATVGELVDTYGRLAPGTLEAREYRAMHGLAFGTDSTRAAAFAVLDTLSTYLPFMAIPDLGHPRFLDEKVELMEFTRESRSGDEARLSNEQLVLTRLARGELAAALDALGHPVMRGPARRGDRGGLLYTAHVQGYPVPVESLERELAVSPDGVGDAAFYAAAWAIEQGREDVHRRTAERFRAAARDAGAAGDSLRAEDLEGNARGLDGLAALIGGDLDAAERELEQARLLTGRATGGDPVNEIVRWWLAEISLERDRLEHAERIFRSLGHGRAFWTNPVAVYRQARVQERLGRLDEARENYEYFLAAFRDPDAELRPWADDARRAIGRLRESRSERQPR